MFLRSVLVFTNEICLLQPFGLVFPRKYSSRTCALVLHSLTCTRMPLITYLLISAD